MVLRILPKNKYFSLRLRLKIKRIEIKLGAVY